MTKNLSKNEKISLAMRGRKLSREHKKMLSSAKIGTSLPMKTRMKIKNTLLGDNKKHLKKVHPLIPKSSNSRSHLTAEEVRDIRNRYSNEKGASLRQLAEEYKVSRHTIHSIVTYKTWT